MLTERTQIFFVSLPIGRAVSIEGRAVYLLKLLLESAARFWLFDHTHFLQSGPLGSCWGRIPSVVLNSSSESCIQAVLLRTGAEPMCASYPDWGLWSACVIEILNNSVINDFVKALLGVQEY